MDEFDFSTGQFQAAWTPEAAMLVFVPNGQRKATLAGEQIVIELKPGTSREQADALATQLNAATLKISLRDLGV